MLKRWHENRRFTFEAVFIFLYMTIPYLDAIFITPNMKCEGQISEERVKTCNSWITKKETKHVRTTERGSGGLYRNPSSTEFLREQERAITDFGRTPDQEKGLTKDY